MASCSQEKNDSSLRDSFLGSSAIHSSLVGFLFTLENHSSIISLTLINTLINDIPHSLPLWKASIPPFPGRAPVVKKRGVVGCLSVK